MPLFSIIDIETNGGSHANGRITEIAILQHDGKKIVEKFETLINPESWIPTFITNMTGISNDMVKDAPKFGEIADTVRRLTQNATFVAHNAAFDYGFIRLEFQRLDEFFEREKLCTVRLSRKIFPNLPSYSLGNLCRSLNIELRHHHRAMADASATTQLFEMLIANDHKGVLKDWL